MVGMRLTRNILAFLIAFLLILFLLSRYWLFPAFLNGKFL